MRKGGYSRLGVFGTMNHYDNSGYKIGESIERNRSVTYENDHDGVALNYEAVGRAVRGVTKSRICSIELDDAWADDIAEYHDKAGKR